MSKKFIFILISSVLVLLLVSLVGYYFIIQNNDPEPGGKVSIFKNFFPFGGNENIEATTTPEEILNEPEVPTEVNFTQKLRKLSVEPVAGAGILDVKAGSIVRYIEKATGHIYEVEMFSPKSGRISNTTIPQVSEAVWGSVGNSLLAQYLRDDNVTVDTYSLTLKNTSTTTENTVIGISFPSGITETATYGNSVFYLQQSSNSSQGYISTFDGTKKKLIWNSEIKELGVQYVNNQTIALNTKPYPFVNGYLYFVDTATGAVKKVLGNIPGLSSLVAPQGTALLYLQEGNTAALYTFNLSTKTTSVVNPTTFPEKCVWSKKDVSIVYCAVPKSTINNSSLTYWYQGQISLNDDIWKYNLKDNTSTIIDNLTADSGEQIDVIKPLLSENEQYLVFINKVDNALWSLDLTK